VTGFAPDPAPIVLGGKVISPGTRTRFQIRVARLPTDTWLSLPVEVVHGHAPGPRLWLTAAVHGDELNGVEIIRRVLESIEVQSMRGALVAVPIVNVFGFIQQLRYLPDRRDLNRSFPGARTGSLASRLAYLLMNEIVANCTHGIDLHTGSHHRANLPQIRADLDDPATRALATAFGAPVIIHARTRDGSLRRAAAKRGKTVLLFEGGEALRFDDDAIEAGVDGVMRAMRALGMLEPSDDEREPPIAILRTRWLRARRGGVLRLTCRLGDHVVEGQPLATVGDVFGRGAATLRAPRNGIVIGQTRNPLVNQGDALVNLGLLG
jgi:hypothetical protein